MVDSSIEPDWDYWLATPTVELWQAIALSLNIDPNNMTIHGAAWTVHDRRVFAAESFPDAETERIFDQRQEQLRQHLKTKYFSALEMSAEKWNCNRVRLDEFAAWAAQFLKKIPGGLAAIAKSPTDGIVDKSSRRNAPLARQLSQEQKILDVIKQLRHDRLALPQAAPGNRGVKHAVLIACRKDEPDAWTDAIFKHAWDRLRATGAIKDAD